MTATDIKASNKNISCISDTLHAIADMLNGKTISVNDKYEFMNDTSKLFVPERCTNTTLSHTFDSADKNSKISHITVTYYIDLTILTVYAMTNDGAMLTNVSIKSKSSDLERKLSVCKTALNQIQMSNDAEKLSYWYSDKGFTELKSKYECLKDIAQNALNQTTD